MKPIFGRVSSLRFQLFLAILIAIFVVVLDSQSRMFVKIRVYMDTIISPFYFLISGSRHILDNVSHMLTTRVQLEIENKKLRQELLSKNYELLLLNQYKQDNIKLRELLGAPLRQDEQTMVAQVIFTSMDPYNDQVVIDKGIDDGVYIGQAVVNEKGVIGQVIAIGKYTSRVLLICDVSHALSIQVLRNGVRMIVSGKGRSKDLQLEYLPGSNTDIQIGDMLVTSSLDGRFPEGYPVAVVSSVRVDKQRACTVIQAHPIADLRYLHYLLLLHNTAIYKETLLPPNTIYRIASERLVKMAPSSSLSSRLAIDTVLRSKRGSVIDQNDNALSLFSNSDSERNQP